MDYIAGIILDKSTFAKCGGLLLSLHFMSTTEPRNVMQKIPKDIRQKLEQNVWCGNCRSAVQIVEYKVDINKLGLILTGQCKNCGHQAVRVIED